MENNDETTEETTDFWLAKTTFYYSKLDERGPIIELTRPGDTSPRYTVAIVDADSPLGPDQTKFAAFVVPPGKEDDWLFCNDEGRELIRQDCHVDRLALISLHDGHTYPKDLRGIKHELEETILELAPDNTTDTRVTFLTMPLKAKVDERNMRVDGMTKFSGEYAIEDVTADDGERYRRLIFSKNGHAIQSEMRLKKDFHPIDGEVEEVDLNYVRDFIYSLVNVGVLLATSKCKKSKYDVLLIGLGAGHLTAIIHKCFKNVRITAVEIEQVVYELATGYFCLKPDERMKIRIEDGLVVLAEAAEKGTKYDAVVIVAANADTKSPYCCPPAAFLDPKVLGDIANCLNEKGLFIMILGCRSLNVKKDIFERLRSTFAGGISMKPNEDNVYELIICWKKGVQITEEEIGNAAHEFYAISQENGLLLVEDIRDQSRVAITQV